MLPDLAFPWDRLDGRPLVALPRNADQPGIAARVEYAGVGLRDSFSRPDPAVLRAKIERVLRDESMRRRAAELREANARAGGAAGAADIVEWVLAHRRPATREALAGASR